MPEHDGVYKLLFSHPRMVEDLLRGFVEEDWVGELDFTSLERVSGSFVSESLRDRHGDLVWRLRSARRDEGWVYLYLLLEFQSTSYRYMAVRMLGYLALLWQELIRRKELAPGGRLPPIVPLVVYNGERSWRVPRSLAPLLAPTPEGLARHLPRFHYLLFDERRLAARHASPENLVASLFRLEASRSPADLPRLAGELVTQLPDEPDLRRAFAVWVVQALRRSFPGAPIPATAALEEIEMIIGQNMREWRERTIRKARQEARQEGLREGVKSLRTVVLSLLQHRFGTLPPEVRRKVSSIRSPEQLEKLAQRAMAAASLDEIGLA